MLKPEEIKKEVIDVLERSLANHSDSDDYEIELKFEEDIENEAPPSPEKASLPSNSIYYQPMYYTYPPQEYLIPVPSWDRSGNMSPTLTSPTMLRGAVAPTLMNIPPQASSFGRTLYINSPSMVFLSQAAPPHSPHSLSDLKFQDDTQRTHTTVPVRESLTHQLQQLKEKQKQRLSPSTRAERIERIDSVPKSMVKDEHYQPIVEKPARDLMRRWSDLSPVHPNENEEFKCEYCDKLFSRSWNYRRHVLIHTGEKPHKCSVCDKAFVLAAHLKIHMRTHTGEKPYQCQTCGHCFAQLTNLQRHMLTHTGEKPFRCKECGKGFVSSSDLRRHIRIHTGEKPYKCDECPKAFTTSGNLASHKLTHAGLKPYSCKICGWKFISSSNHRAHMKSRHPQIDVYGEAGSPTVEDAAHIAVKYDSDQILRSKNSLSKEILPSILPKGKIALWPMSDKYLNMDKYRYPFGTTEKQEHPMDSINHFSSPTMIIDNDDDDDELLERHNVSDMRKYTSTVEKHNMDFEKARENLLPPDENYLIDDTEKHILDHEEVCEIVVPNENRYSVSGSEKYVQSFQKPREGIFPFEGCYSMPAGERRGIARGSSLFPNNDRYSTSDTEKHGQSIARAMEEKFKDYQRLVAAKRNTHEGDKEYEISSKESDFPLPVIANSWSVKSPRAETNSKQDSPSKAPVAANNSPSHVKLQASTDEHGSEHSIIFSGQHIDRVTMSDVPMDDSDDSIQDLETTADPNLILPAKVMA